MRKDELDVLGSITLSIIEGVACDFLQAKYDKGEDCKVRQVNCELMLQQQPRKNRQ